MIFCYSVETTLPFVLGLLMIMLKLNAVDASSGIQITFALFGITMNQNRDWHEF